MSKPAGCTQEKLNSSELGQELALRIPSLINKSAKQLFPYRTKGLACVFSGTEDPTSRIPTAVVHVKHLHDSVTKETDSRH